MLFEDIDDFSILKAYAKTHHKDKLYLILREGKLIRPSQYKRKWHKFFQKVLTWDDTLVDNKKYFKYYIPQLLYEKQMYNIPFNKKKSVCIINSNKIGIGKGELYSERKDIILFFQDNLKDFDVYGEGWNQKQLKLMSFLHCAKNILKFNKRTWKYAFDYFFNFKKVKNYKGRVDGNDTWQNSSRRCIEVLKDYKFAICYENTNADSGYISEKIFNCMNARCVPIYLGDPNILKTIPAGCFIDRRWFESNDDMLRYLVCLKEEKYDEYIMNINNFLFSDKAKLFSEAAYQKRIKMIFGVDSSYINLKQN